MTLTLRQMEILVAAAEAETFSAAAQQLGISQPSLSESIRRVEATVGLLLFERTTRSLKLTHDGRKAVAIARELVQDFKHALKRLSMDSGGRIAVAALPSVACAAIPEALAAFHRVHPGVAVTIHDVQHERAMAMLRDGVVDFAVTLKPAREDGLIFDAVAFDVTHLVCRRDHPFAKKRAVRWRDLAEQAFIGITHISSVRRLTDAGFLSSELSIDPRYEVEQVPSAIALVKAGLGITALPSLTFTMFKDRELAVRPLIDPVMRRNVGFVTRQQRRLPASVDELKYMIRKRLQHDLSGAQR